jgi:hypothetical protein
MPTILGANTLSTGAYEVANSCRFNDGDSAYMHKTPSADGNRRTFTFSFWVKRGELTSHNPIAEVYSSGENVSQFYFNASDQFTWYESQTSNKINLTTNAKQRDPSAWYHIVVKVDTTESTNTDRVKIYINNELQTITSGSNTYPDQNFQSYMNSTHDAIEIGRTQYNSNQFDGYLAEVCMVDGSALAPSSFGEADEDSPTIWKPIDVSGLSFGTNGFYLDFEASDNLGNDANGGTDFTEVNLAAADQASDTCTNNFCTMNPLDNYPISTLGTFSEGNCIVVTGQGASSSNGYSHFTGTFGLTAGKWYWEAMSTNQGAASLIGIVDKPADAANASLNAYTYGYSYRHSDGDIYNNGSGADYGNSYGTSDIIGVALDLDNNKLYFSKGGTWQNSGDPTSGSTGTGAKSITAAASTNTGVYHPVVGDTDYSTTSTFALNFGGCPAFAISSGNADGNGYGNFEYEPPSGYLALCTKNLGSDGG